MPNKNLTEIAIILDRSGSMSSIKDDMEGGFKQFIEDQKKIPDPCVVSLYQFDTEFEVKFEEKKLHEVQGLGLDPRGGTALLDACGKTISLIGQRLSAKHEEQRPGRVIVMIITDGHENASKEYKRADVAAKVKHQTETYNWQFAFLGANINSFDEASSLGITGAAVMNYVADSHGVGNMYGSISCGVSNYRKASYESAELGFAPMPDDDKNSKEI